VGLPYEMVDKKEKGKAMIFFIAGTDDDTE
jgi:hypothetical protein